MLFHTSLPYKTPEHPVVDLTNKRLKTSAYRRDQESGSHSEVLNLIGISERFDTTERKFGRKFEKLVNEMEIKSMSYESDLNLKATELRLALPGSDEPEKQSTPCVRSNKRASSEISEKSKSSSCVTNAGNVDCDAPPPAKAQVVGWPPIRSYMKNCLRGNKNDGEGVGRFVKVSMDGAPYLRKIDLRVYNSYSELLKALENMFTLTIGDYSEREGYHGSEYAPTYEDKDGDWMLVGDVPWEMFISSCKRLRIMKGSEARGLGCSL